MPRTSKKPVDRKMEFIRVAEDLFNEKGFENTSVDDIVDRMNVAKGLFYYYFDSKEELLVAIINRLLDEIQSSITSGMEKKGLTALERFKELTPSNAEISNRSKMIVALFHKERNQAYYHIMEERASKFIIPAVERVIKQGVEEGIFHTDYPRETAIALVTILPSLRKSVPPEPSPDQFVQMNKATQELSERILGAKSGTFNELWESLLPRAAGKTCLKISDEKERC